MTRNGGEHFDWNLLVPLVVHPLKVAIVEALHWIGRPVSPTDVSRMFGEDTEDHYLSLVAYHASKLEEIGAVEVVRTRPARGALEKFYDLRLPERG
ncbi:MAG TPA: hypothetical protein VMT37_01730 [Solirubrobacterales bacterium]|nr:hypothetical protein [Solirubrobacterales bacterium]